MEKIIIMVGGIETLDFFLRRMGEYFKKAGYTVFELDLKGEKNQVKHLKKFLKPKKSALITFNFEGLQKESLVYSEDSGYIWENYDVQIFNITADHPFYYDECFDALPKNYHHLCIDRNHASYIKRFYPDCVCEGFLPLGGTDICKEMPKPIKERKTSILFTGNFTPLSFFEPYIHAINEEYAAFYMGMIDALIKDSDRTVEDVVYEKCRKEIGSFSDTEFKKAMSKTVFVDMYVRNYMRGEVVRKIADAGLKITVIGKGWDKLENLHPENMTILPQDDSLGCLKASCEAKLCLNVMPWFRDGAHDRIFNSMLCGSVCLTDPSTYLMQELEEGQGVSYYDLKDLDSLAGQIRALLKNEDNLQKMADEGRKKALLEHTWENRARTLDEIIQKAGK